MFKTLASADRDEAILRKRSISIGSAIFILGVAGVVALALINRLSTFEISLAMIAAGLLQISHAIAAHRRGWPAFTILGALLYLAGALAVLFQPLVDTQWIDLLLVGSLAAAGISRLVTATRLGARLRGWEALSGITTLGIAGAIQAGLPEMSLWPLGFAIALDLIVEGGTLANIGWAMRASKAR